MANVTPVATAPTAADGTVTTNEDTDHVFAAANFNYATGNADPLASVKITGLPAAGKGTLALDGTAIAATALPKTVTATELTANKLKYSPPANANGTAYASFTFKVNDGTADSAEYTMTINVTAVKRPGDGRAGDKRHRAGGPDADRDGGHHRGCGRVAEPLSYGRRYQLPVDPGGHRQHRDEHRLGDGEPPTRWWMPTWARRSR